MSKPSGSQESAEIGDNPLVPPGPTDKQDSSLTVRQRQVLQLIVNGNSNREIAAQLNLSPNTVAVHRTNIMTTIGIHKTAPLVVYAIRKGLVRQGVQ